MIYKNMHTNLLTEPQAAAWLDSANMAADLNKKKKSKNMTNASMFWHLIDGILTMKLLWEIRRLILDVIWTISCHRKHREQRIWLKASGSVQTKHH